MAKKTTKKKTSKTTKKAAGKKSPSAAGKQLVIVESPSKAKTINRYLGPDYVVLASVGHVRDLPTKAKKGEKKGPVPGVDLDENFRPTYEVVSGKGKVITDLKRAAKAASSIWFATDLDREGEAIAWHLAEELGIPPASAKRVIFSAITRDEIQHAFANPHPIDIDRVNAQQARRILDRIVGYQVSPLLWKKVARGLSAGRVQSVAVRVVVEREREIRAFVPDESWQIRGMFALAQGEAAKLGPAWRAFMNETDDKGNRPTLKAQRAWAGDNGLIEADLIEIGGDKFQVALEVGGRPSPIDTPEVTSHDDPRFVDPETHDLTGEVADVARLAGLDDVTTSVTENDKAKGPARWVRTVEGVADPSVKYSITSIETKKTTSRTAPPYITSTLQQAASTRLGFEPRRTMRAAQRLYEGVEIPGEGPVGLITYMRTDSTHLSGQALEMAREFIKSEYGDRYLPAKPNFFKAGKGAQEAHEAIRPTSTAYPPSRVRNALKSDEQRLYALIWERFIACQMVPAEWDATTVTLEGGRDPKRTCKFKASGRVLVFDGHYKVSGVPKGGDTANLPKVSEGDDAFPAAMEVEQKFTSPPARYTGASLVKALESEGIGRPSTYASIVQVIQDRKYVEQIERKFFATDLGEVVTDKLIEAFPRIMDLGYTRKMEEDLDKIEEEHLDWIEMLQQFYGPFRERLEVAESEMKHAKAEVQPAPAEYKCEKCGSSLVYRFGKNGRFLSCSTYPDCDYACPCDREGRPRKAEVVNVCCPKTGRPMVRRTGRFGPFLATQLRDGEKATDVGLILNIDKTGHVTAPSQPPLETDLPCPKCESPLNLRNGVRGPWLGCSAFPKCRGRGKWADLEEKAKADLEAQLAAHDKAHPIPIIRTLDGRDLTDSKGKPLPDAPTVEALMIDPDEAESMAATGEARVA